MNLPTGIACACTMAALMTACSSGPSTGMQKRSIEPLVATPSCTFIVRESRPCRMVGPTGNQTRVCKLYVQNSDIGPVMSTKRVRVPKPELGASAPVPAVIVWEAGGGGDAHFTQNDGPLELKSDARFEGASPTEDPNGLDASQQGNTGRYYRIKFKNEVIEADDTIQYSLRFRDETGSPVICDPFINNSGG